MPKTRKGYVMERADGFYARFDYTDDQGKRRSVTRKGANKSEAERLLKKLVREFEDRGAKALDGERATFAEFAAQYGERYIVEPTYVGGRKVAGLRSHDRTRSQLKPLVARFGRKRLRAITYGDIEAYKTARLRERYPTAADRKRAQEVGGPLMPTGERAIASVNRELALLRRMLGVAVREGLLVRNPFGMGEPLIRAADEVKRERVLGRDEEARLLEACTGQRAHLRPLIICALATGMRKGEILRLLWSDVDLASGSLRIRAMNTKTMAARSLVMTPRLRDELARLAARKTPDPEARVFGVAYVKRSFTNACLAAGIHEFRFHDLRHTVATRLVAAGIPLAEVGRILGHTVPSTTYRYANLTSDAAQRAADALAVLDEGASPEREDPTPVN